MKRPPKAICLFKRKDLLHGNDFNVVDLSFNKIILNSFPINSSNQFAIKNELDFKKFDCIITSPICGLEKTGIACAWSCESGINNQLFGFSQSPGVSISPATAAALWLVYEAALLIAKVRIRNVDSFLCYKCFESGILTDISQFMVNTNFPEDIKKKAIDDFLIGHIHSFSALTDSLPMGDKNSKAWTSTWMYLSDFMWNFSHESRQIAEALDARYLCGLKELNHIEFSSNKNIIIKIDRKKWTTKSMDINTAFFEASCISQYINNMPVLTTKNSIFSIRKNYDIDNRIIDLWNDVDEFSKGLFYDRIKWDDCKEAVRNWYISMLRKYNYAS